MIACVAHLVLRVDRFAAGSGSASTAWKPESSPLWKKIRPSSVPVVGEHRPAAAADLVAFVAAFPGELDAGSSLAGGLAAVHQPLDRDESELPGPVMVELDEPGLHQVDGVGVPQLHRYDPPSAREARQVRHPGPSASPHAAAGNGPAVDARFRIVLLIVWKPP